MGTYAADHTIAVNSKHTSAGVPADCTKVTDSAAATGIQAADAAACPARCRW